MNIRVSKRFQKRMKMFHSKQDVRVCILHASLILAHQRYGPDFGAGNNDMSEHIETIDVFRTVAPSTGETISDNTSIYVVSLDDQGTHMDGAIDMDGEEIQAANQVCTLVCF